MRILSICVFIVMCLVAKGTANTIMCYECDDCDVLDDTQLKSCPHQSVTKLPTTKKPTTIYVESTTPTEESTLETSTLFSSSPAEITTIHAEPITEIPSEVETDPPLTNETEEPQEISSQSPESETESPLILSPIITNGEIRPEVAPEISQSIENIPPAAQFPFESYEPEVVYSNVPQSVLQPSEYNQPYQIFNRAPRHVRSSRTDVRVGPSYHCYSANIVDGDERRVKKGCIEVPEDKAACDVLRDEFGESVDKCKICTKDKCNSAVTIKYSLITIVILAVTILY